VSFLTKPSRIHLKDTAGNNKGDSCKLMYAYDTNSTTAQAINTTLKIAASKPERPAFAFRPRLLTKIVRYFSMVFTAKILYAVKTNPEAHIIQHLYNEGITAFDVASLQEIILVKQLCPNADLYFMHPVKPKQSIREAYFKYNVRHFSLDSFDELAKITAATDGATDLCLHLRLGIPNIHAELNLSEKFGAEVEIAHTLLDEIKKTAKQVGICFHVGSQCMHPDAYRLGMRMAKQVMDQSSVKIDFLNVGGGFPSIYPGMTPPPLVDYFNAIDEEFNIIKRTYPNLILLSEPGRALVAEPTSVIVRVDLRKDDTLYINDGTYGSLFDAGIPNFIFPVKVLCEKRMGITDMVGYSFYGPTCDKLDYMKGPFYLPKDISQDDYIEIGQLGAYGRTLATNFNGFSHHENYFVIDDEPLMTMYSHLPPCQ
jgi:ornithine decarboxylase